MKCGITSPSLDPARIAAACRSLAARIEARLPSRNLSVHACAFADHAEQVVRRGEAAVAAPRWLKVASWIGGAGALLLLLSPLAIVRRTDGIEVLPTFLQALDSALTSFAATVAGFFTMRSLTRAAMRKRALEGLGALRDFTHVTDMLQISKSPSHLIFGLDPKGTCPPREEDVAVIGAYLAYCGELSALIAKLSVLYGRWVPDATVLATVDDIEDLCSKLEAKTMAKLALLERHKRAESGE